MITSVPSAPARPLAILLCAAAIASGLSACGAKPVRPATDTGVHAPDSAPATSTRRGGGYYKDDGPDDIPPGGLDDVPDAEPRLEPLHRFANRPYTVFGQNYVPVTQLAPHRERGLASWYGRRFHGNPTSSGERYDMYAMTAAHPTLPIPSYARVTRVATGRSVVVRINDRGPFHKGRIIDLSYTAAHKLGYVNAGSTEVEVEQILPEELPMLASDRPVPPLSGRTPVPVAISPAVTVSAAPGAAMPGAAVSQLAEAGSGIYLQLGAFTSFDNAEGFRSTVAQQIAAFAERLELFSDGDRFRLHAGPYASLDEARAAADGIAAVLRTRPFVIVR